MASDPTFVAPYLTAVEIAASVALGAGIAALPLAWLVARTDMPFRRTVRAADVVIAGNDFLADCALRSGARAESVWVIPTCVETDAYSIARPPGRTGGIELAWIGSSSTLAGLESRRDLWERVGREVAGARLRVICDRHPYFGPLAVVPVAWSEATEAAATAGSGA